MPWYIQIYNRSHLCGIDKISSYIITLHKDEGNYEGNNTKKIEHKQVKTMYI